MRPARPRNLGLVASIWLATSLHALTLWALGASKLHASAQVQQLSATHVQARLLKLAPTILKLAVAETRETAAPEYAPEIQAHAGALNGKPQPTASPAATPDRARMAPDRDEQQPAHSAAQLTESLFAIEHPDSPLPGGKATARFVVELNADGSIESLALTSDSRLPPAFTESVRSTFLGQQATRAALDLLGRPIKGRLCLEVDFSEQAAPHWQILSSEPGQGSSC